MEVRAVLRRVRIVSIVRILISHVMLAGGLAVTLHSMVTVSCLVGVLLLPLITKLLRGTTKGTLTIYICRHTYMYSLPNTFRLASASIIMPSIDAIHL